MAFRWNLIVGALGALSLGAISGQASAAVITATYTGHLTFGYDRTGVFGAAGTVLTGAAFVAEYKFDTDLGLHSPTADPQFATGGASVGAATPALGSKITINGQSVSIFGDDFAEVYLGESHLPGFATTIFSQQKHKLTGLYSEADTSYIEIDTNALGIPTDFDQPFTYVLSPDDSAFGELVINHHDADLGSLAYVEASLKAEKVEFALASPAAVPEPATWALMIGGFGLAGMALRRRAAQTAV